MYGQPFKDVSDSGLFQFAPASSRTSSPSDGPSMSSLCEEIEVRLTMERMLEHVSRDFEKLIHDSVMVTSQPKSIGSFEESFERSFETSSQTTKHRVHFDQLFSFHGGLAAYNTPQSILPPTPPLPYSDVMYPQIYISVSGTIGIMFRNELLVEMSIDKSLRVVQPGRFAAAINARGTTASIMHSYVRIVHTDVRIFAYFDNGMKAVFGPKGIIFGHKNNAEAHIVSSSYPQQRAIFISAEEFLFPNLDVDFTQQQFQSQSLNGEQYFQTCSDIVARAAYSISDDNQITLHINNLKITQTQNGDLELDWKPRYVFISPSTGSLIVRTHFAEMKVESNGKATVKRGQKLLHSSNSGLVVSDGKCKALMDLNGNLI